MKNKKYLFYGLLILLAGSFGSGGIWLGSMNGVYRYDGDTITNFKSKPEKLCVNHQFKLIYQLLLMNIN